VEEHLILILYLHGHNLKYLLWVENKLLMYYHKSKYKHYKNKVKLFQIMILIKSKIILFLNMKKKVVVIMLVQDYGMMELLCHHKLDKS